MASILDQTTPVPGSNRLKTLQDFFGLSPDTPNGDGNLGAMSADDAILGSALHSARTNETLDRAATGDRVAQKLAPQMVADEQTDPYSDVTNNARNMAAQKAADTVAQFLSPGESTVRAAKRGEAADQAGQEAYAKGMGTAEAGVSEPAQKALDAATQRKIQENEALYGLKNGKLSQQEQQLVDTSQAIGRLGTNVLEDFKTRYPGIDTDPQKYASPVSDMLTSKVGKGWYSLGGMTENDDILQKVGAIQAWAMRSLIAGRINKQMMDIINAHLPQPGFSPGANYDRLNRLLTEVIPSQLQGVGAGHSFRPNDPLAGYPNGGQ